jgi:glutamate/tyrosine decarboxylase-like PLP-dependent enzyme
MLYLEPHELHALKWGLTVFDCSTFWVKDRTLLTEALDVTPEFLRSRHGDSGMMSYNFVEQG